MFSLSRLLVILTLMVAAVGIVLPLAPILIGAIASPIRAFEVTSAERLPDGRLEIMGRLDKRWCVFRNLGFAWRGPENNVWRVPFEVRDQPDRMDRNRPGGVQSVGPWLIAPPPSEAATHLDITVRHRCGMVAVVTRLAQIDTRER